MKYLSDCKTKNVLLTSLRLLEYTAVLSVVRYDVTRLLMAGIMQKGLNGCQRSE